MTPTGSRSRARGCPRFGGLPRVGGLYGFNPERVAYCARCATLSGLMTYGSGSQGRLQKTQPTLGFATQRLWRWKPSISSQPNALTSLIQHPRSEPLFQSRARSAFQRSKRVLLLTFPPAHTALFSGVSGFGLFKGGPASSAFEMFMERRSHGLGQFLERHRAGSRFFDAGHAVPKQRRRRPENSGHPPIIKLQRNGSVLQERPAQAPLRTPHDLAASDKKLMPGGRSKAGVLHIGPE